MGAGKVWDGASNSWRHRGWLASSSTCAHACKPTFMKFKVDDLTIPSSKILEHSNMMSAACHVTSMIKRKNDGVGAAMKSPWVAAWKSNP